MFKKITFLFFLVTLVLIFFKVFNLNDLILEKINFIKKDEIQEENPFNNKEKITVNYSLQERIKRGDIYFKEGFLELARDEFFKALEIEKNYEVYLKLAETQEKLKNYQGAIENLKNAGHIKNSPEIQLELVKNHLHLFEEEKALERLKYLKGVLVEADYYLQVLELLNTENLNPDFKVLHTENFKKAKNLAKAFEKFSFYKDVPLVFLDLLLADKFLENSEPEFAYKISQKILKKRSDYRDAWIINAYSSLLLDKQKESLFAFKKAYELDPLKPETQYFLGILKEELGNKQEAYHFLKLAYKNHYEPQIHVLQKLAETSFSLGKFQESYQFYSDYLQKNSQKVDDFIRPIHIALDKLSDTKKAEKIIYMVEKYYPKQAQTYNLKAWVALKKDNLKQAQVFLDQAFKLNPNFSSAWYNQGVLYEKQNKKTKALKAYENAYQNDKNGDIGRLSAESYNRLLK